MILVCPKCKASYEARLKDPSKPEPKGEVQIRCLACGNPFLISEGSLKQELLNDLVDNRDREWGEFPMDSLSRPSESSVQDHGELDFPVFEEIEEPLQEAPPNQDEDRIAPLRLGSKYFSMFLLFLVLGLVFGGGLLYRFFWVSSNPEVVHTRSPENQALRPKEGVFRAVVPFSALSLEKVSVEKKKNRFDESFILVRGRLKNMGTVRIHDRFRIVARAYKKDGSLKEIRSTLPGNDLSPSFTEQASVFELIAKSELPAPEDMPILLEPNESLPFGLVFPIATPEISKIEIAIEAVSQ